MTMTQNMHLCIALNMWNLFVTKLLKAESKRASCLRDAMHKLNLH